MYLMIANVCDCQYVVSYCYTLSSFNKAIPCEVKQTKWVPEMSSRKSVVMVSRVQ